MKRLLNSVLLLVILLSALTLLPTIVKAQDDPPPIGDPGCNPYGYDAQGHLCPIDSNIYILLAAGVLYGIKKVKDARVKEVN